MKKIKFAVIGCGHIGKRHIAVLDAEPKAEIFAISDIDAEICVAQSKLYNDLAWYDNYIELLKKDFDVAIISTPHGLHYEMSMLASNAGKHVLVEKPMALKALHCEEMISQAKKNNVTLSVVKQNRFNKPIELVNKALIENKLGKIYFVKCDVFWNRYKEYYTNSSWKGSKELEGGALYTQVSHFIDLLVWWFGVPKKCKTTLSNKYHNIEIEDTGSTLLEFEKNISGNINWTNCVYNKNYEGSITLIGEKGTIKIGGQYLNKIEFWDVQSYPIPENVEFTDKPNNYGKYQGSSSNHHKVIRDYIAALSNQENTLVHGSEGKDVIETIEKIYNSA